MIDMTIDAPYDPAALCECGDPECLGAADAVTQIVDDLLASTLPTLKLIQERDEARELVKRVLMATEGATGSKEYYAAMLEARRAAMSWKGGAQ
jgi:hypothetical protein